jgi:hypothetical protein
MGRQKILSMEGGAREKQVRGGKARLVVAARLGHALAERNKKKKGAKHKAH